MNSVIAASMGIMYDPAGVTFHHRRLGELLKKGVIRGTEQPCAGRREDQDYPKIIVCGTEKSRTEPI